MNKRDKDAHRLGELTRKLEDSGLNFDEMPEFIELLLADRKRLQATVAELPVHADTAERFVPGRDKAWMLVDGKAYKVTHSRYWEEWGHVLHESPRGVAFTFYPVYSSREAAEAAAGKGE